MNRKIAWPRVFAEGAMIVISILMAFGIEAWWVDRNETQASDGYIERLKADLTQDTAGLAYLLRGLDRKRQALVALRSRTIAREGLAAVVLQAEQYGWGQFTFSGTTFEDLKSTGNLRLLQSDDLRGALVDYYEVWAFEQGRIGARRSELPSLIFKLLPIEFSASINTPGHTVDENRALDLRDVGEADLTALESGLEAPAFRAELQHELNYTGFAATALTRLLREAQELLALLESASG